MKIDTAKEENDLVDGGLRYDLTVPLARYYAEPFRMSFRHRSKHCRSGMYGEQTVRRKDVSDSSCSAILIFWVNREILQRLS